jgi:hypothetical protein
MMKRLAFLLACCLLLLFSTANTRTAVALSGVTITPYAQEISVKSDEITKNIQITVQNNTNYDDTFRVSVVDFGSLDDSGGIVFAGTKGASLNADTSLSKWLVPEVDTITLKKGEKQAITVVLHNDQELKPGGHYAAIVLTSQSQSTPKDGKVNVNESLSSLLFLRKIGGETYDLHLDKVDVDGGFFQLPTKAILHFKNNGNTHVVPRGIVSVKEGNDTVLKRGVINTDSLLVLPGAERKIETSLANVLRPGLLPRSYKLQIDYRYDGHDAFATKMITIHYIYIPAYVTLLGVLSASGLSLYIYFRKKSKK